MKYTEQQLIEAQMKYNSDFLADPKNFKEINDSYECAKEQVTQLISYVQ